MCKNVFITDEKYSKLLKMYNSDYLNHREVDYYVSENQHVNLKSTQKNCNCILSFQNASYPHYRLFA